MRDLTYVSFHQLVAKLEEECRKREVGGFFIVADLEVGNAYFRLINLLSPLRMGVPEKKDCNFAAVAGAKFGMVFAHKRDTGRPTNVVGEVPWKGGHLSKDGRFGYFFSGAPEDVDLELMQLAEQWHEELSRT